MPVPGESKTVQERILFYAQELGWQFVPRVEAESRRQFDPDVLDRQRARTASLVFREILHNTISNLNPDYDGGRGTLAAELAHLQSSIYGNRDMLGCLRNQRTFFVPAERRELDLHLIDYDDITRCPKDWCNTYEVTEEFVVQNSQHTIREDIVFLINGVPVITVECKNATKNEALAIAIDQIRRYHDEAPEVMVPQMLFTVTEAIGFSYGATWNTVRRNIFPWKDEQIGNLEAKVKSFFAIPHVLRLLRDFIVFAEKEGELQKIVLRQHQTEAVDRVVDRALDPMRARGLVWHTQGSGKTYTMIKSAELLFKAPSAEKPTILLMIDRNELEDQLLRNLAAVGLENVAHAHSTAELYRLLRSDYRGIVVTMIHKFNDMPGNLNPRRNIFVLIDEAHRSTGGDLGTYLMAGLPNASLIGFTGTPIDRTAYGKGTFKTFGIDDERGYLHKYSIAESIEDGTTLPLYYNLAPNDLLVPHDLLDREFLSAADAEGVADIEELNAVLDRAVNLKTFLKGGDRVAAVAQYVAEHYRQYVEPLGYKAFLVAVDREACALYKEALDTIMPNEETAVVYTENPERDTPLVKRWYLSTQQEREIRKSFTRIEANPKILIVTEKLLTGYDAPILYAMYLDKPMRDHTLLQAIARVNRPYELEGEKAKPHGFVLDFVGIFDKLEQALAFDSDEINAVVRDMSLLKDLFADKMKTRAGEYLGLVSSKFIDRDVDSLIEYFRDKERRQEFFKEYKEIEMLYEVISPDAFLRPYLDDYRTLSSIYAVVRNAYSRRIYVDKAFEKKTSQLVQQHVGVRDLAEVTDFVEINENTIEVIKQQGGGDNVRVINLIKSITKAAEEQSGDPFLVAMAERARAVQESYENRQTSTAEALRELQAEIERNTERHREQAKRGLDSVTYFVLTRLKEEGIANAEATSRKIASAFSAYPNWRRSERELRELRQEVTFGIYAEEDDLGKVTSIVDNLFAILGQG
jgi:type I restriction enzyme R subunit